MNDQPERRKSDVSQRLDKQDEVLEELRQILLEHAQHHQTTDPAVLELVDILRGMKFLRQIAFWLASVVGALYAFFSFVWDHVKFVK